jgi:LysM repeat protein
MLEQKNKGRAKVKVAVFFVLAVHGVGLLAALLMQGCRREDANANNNLAPTNNPAAPVFADQTNTVPVPTTNDLANLTTPAATNTTPVEPVTTTAGAAQDYKIVAGDNFSTLGKKFGVTAAAITAANPGVEPTKLKIGQTIHIPTPVAAATTNHSTPSVTPANGEMVYTVVSNDTLSKIAGKYNVKVNALRDANGLTTDKIKVGQKLKIPGKTGSPTIADTNVVH